MCNDELVQKGENVTVSNSIRMGNISQLLFSVTSISPSH